MCNATSHIAETFLSKIIEIFDNSEYECWTFGGNITGNTRVDTGDARRVIESTLTAFLEYLEDGTLPSSDDNYM